ncbi:unnamed protein product, partial [Colias eurytheme]
MLIRTVGGCDTWTARGGDARKLAVVSRAAVARAAYLGLRDAVARRRSRAAGAISYALGYVAPSRSI